MFSQILSINLIRYRYLVSSYNIEVSYGVVSILQSMVHHYRSNGLVTDVTVVTTVRRRLARGADVFIFVFDIGRSLQNIQETKYVKMGRPLNQNDKIILYNMFNYFQRLKPGSQKTYGKVIQYESSVGKIVAEATGLSERSVIRVVFEAKLSLQKTGQVKFSAPNKPKEIRKKIIINDLDLEVIKRKIHEMYVLKLKMPSARQLNLALKKNGILNCGETYLRELLRKMGYSYEQHEWVGFVDSEIDK